MKNIVKLISVILLASTVLSCAKDNEPGGGGTKGTDYNANRWIHDKMQEWYLWPDEVPGSPDFNTDFDSFFHSLLTTKHEDGQRDEKGNHRGSFYSQIKRVKSTRLMGGEYERTHGIEFTLMRYGTGKNDDPVMAIITYVKPGSPAESAGLMRGDRIFNVNDVDMIYGNYSGIYPKLLSDRYGDGNPQSVTVRWYRQLEGKNAMGPASVSPMTMENNPVAICKKVAGTNTGYLLYNSFETGGDGNVYDDRLKASLRALGDIDNLVVDLRYNGGGYVSSCRLLASMIAPADKAGTTTFMTREYNKNRKPATENFMKVSEMKSSGYGTKEEGLNLDLTRLYVLTSGSSASASELLIHSLRGAGGIDVYIVGDYTHGKNVGMSGLYSSTIDGYKYEMWPVTFYSVNAKGEKFSAQGFKPQHSVDELSQRVMNPLGDPSEALLGAALYHIRNSTFSGYSPATRADGGSAAYDGKQLYPTRLYTPAVIKGILYIEEE